VFRLQERKDNGAVRAENPVWRPVNGVALIMEEMREHAEGGDEIPGLVWCRNAHYRLYRWRSRRVRPSKIKLARALPYLLALLPRSQRRRKMELRNRSTCRLDLCLCEADGG
jgi:hypothetical protein